MHKSMLLTLAATAAYFAAAYWLKAAYDPLIIAPDVAGRKILLKRPFINYSDSKFAVLAPDYWFAAVADPDDDDEERSNVVIYEDGAPLGPAHTTPHEDIGTEGRGRFSHWRHDKANSVFLFSSSDNTDPRTNGRSYWAVTPDAAVTPKKEIPKPNGKIVVRLRRPFEMFKGSHMAIAHGLDALAEFADDTQNEGRSPIELYENDRQLGPAHSSHRDIAATGEGRYSHWKTQGIVFSTSDNSDPNRNRRRYWAVLPADTEQ